MNKIDYYSMPNIDKCNGSPKKVTFQVCEDTMIFLVLYPIISNILSLFFKNNFMLLQGLFLIIYTILLTLIRIKIKNHILGIILSLVLCCIFIAMPFSNYERILYGIYAVLMLVNSIKKFFKVSFTFYNLPFFALGEILLLINLMCAYGLNNSSVKYLTLFSALAFLFIFLFYFSRSRYILLINSEKHRTSNITVKLNSKKFITILFCISLTFMSFFLLITHSINSNANYTVVNKLMDIFIRQESISPNPNTNNASVTDLHKAPNLHEHHKAILQNTNNYKYSLPKWAYITACLTLTVLILFIIFKVIKLVLTLKINNQEIEEGESTFLKEDLKKDLHNIVPNFTFNLSNKEKLRKYYKKLIKRYRKKGLSIKTSSTSRELKDGILNLTGDDIKDITKIYNKARYSLYEPTENDIDKLKKM